MVVPVIRLPATAVIVAICAIVPPYASATSQTIESAFAGVDR
jgi:hypothetical protein